MAKIHQLFFIFYLMVDVSCGDIDKHIRRCNLYVLQGSVIIFIILYALKVLSY